MGPWKTAQRCRLLQADKYLAVRFILWTDCWNADHRLPETMPNFHGCGQFKAGCNYGALGEKEQRGRLFSLLRRFLCDSEKQEAWKAF